MVKRCCSKWLNGHGKWFNSLLEETQEELVDIVLGLPLFIELETKHGKKLVYLMVISIWKTGMRFIHLLQNITIKLII